MERERESRFVCIRCASFTACAMRQQRMSKLPLHVYFIECVSCISDIQLNGSRLSKLRFYLRNLLHAFEFEYSEQSV